MSVLLIITILDISPNTIIEQKRSTIAYLWFISGGKRK